MTEIQLILQYDWLGKTYQVKAMLEFHEKLQTDFVHATEFFRKVASNHVDDPTVSDFPLDDERGENVMDVENKPSNSQKETAGENTCQDDNNQTFVNAEEDTTINTWTGPATKLLLEEYKKWIERFRNPKVKKVTLWREFEVVLKAKKLNFDTTTIQGKFRNMKHTYGKIKKNNSRKTTGAGRLSWPWLNEMEEIFHDDFN